MTNIDMTKLTKEQLTAMLPILPEAAQAELDRRAKAEAAATKKQEAELYYNMSNQKLYYADMYKAIMMLKPFFEGKTNQVRKALIESGMMATMEKLLRTNEKLMADAGKPITGKACYEEIYGGGQTPVAPTEAEIPTVEAEVIPEVPVKVELEAPISETTKVTLDIAAVSVPVDPVAPIPAAPQASGFDMSAIMAKAQQVKAAGQ